MIPRETVDKIISSAQIVDVIGDFVSLKRRGANYVACCPFHNEKTPSFYVSPAKGIFTCFGCHKSGTAVGFVMEKEQLDYPGALRYLARKYGIEVKEKEETPEEIAARQRTESLYLVLDYAEKTFQANLDTDEGKALGYAYFRSRGLEDATIRKYGLGWSMKDRFALSKAAVSAGYKEEYLTAVGVSIKRDRGDLVDKFYERAMFPIHSVSGRVVGFGGRTLRSDYKEANIGKYVNSPENEIYHKRDNIYGLYFAKSEIVRQKKCYLVEGYLDVLSMHQLGITNVVASSGTALTHEQIYLLRNFSENITLMFDGDAAGIHAALRSIDLVLEAGMNVRVVLLPGGQDPDDFAKSHTLEEVRSFLDENEQDFITYEAALKQKEAGKDPMKKAELISSLADSVALIPDAIKRTAYVQLIAERFAINEKVLYDRIDVTRRRRLEEKIKEERERNGYGEPVQVVQGQETGVEIPEVTTPTVTDSRVLENPFMAPCERELLTFILRYGDSALSFASDSEYYFPGEPDTVANFIRNSIEESAFTNSVHKRTFDAYFSLYDSESCPSQQEMQHSLMNGADRQVAALVSELIEDKHMLTIKAFEDSVHVNEAVLAQKVPKSVIAYQMKYIRWKQLGLQERMKNMRDTGGDDDSLVEEFSNLEQIWRRLAEKSKRK